MSRKLRFTIFIVFVIVAMIDLSVGLHWALRYPGVDERVRIVGARLLLNHLDAYKIVDTEANPFYRQFSPNTYTPVLLMLYAPFRWRPYETQHLLFFFFDWACLAAIFFLTRLWWKAEGQAIHAAAFTLFLLADFGLLLHMERGQYYIFLAALMAVAITVWRRSSTQSVGSVAVGILIAIRPTCLLLLPVLWILRFRSQAIRTLLVAGLLVGSTMVAFGLQPWREYEVVVQRFQDHAIELPFVGHVADVSQPGTEQDAYTRVEGQDFSKSVKTHYFIDRAFMQLAAQQGVRRITMRVFRTPKNFARTNSFLLALTAVYCLVLAYPLRTASVDIRLGFAFLTPTLIECFAPTRHVYGDVTLAPVLILMAAILTRQPDTLREFRTALAVLTTVLVLSFASGLLLSPEGNLIAVFSLLRWFACLLFASWFFLRKALRAPSERKPASAAQKLELTMGKPAESRTL